MTATSLPRPGAVETIEQARAIDDALRATSRLCDDLTFVDLRDPALPHDDPAGDDHRLDVFRPRRVDERGDRTMKGLIVNTGKIDDRKIRKPAGLHEAK